MDEKNNEKIKEIRISFDLIVVLYILIFLAIISIRISLGINPSINEMLYLIFTIIIFMFIMSFVRDLTIYRMWEDIIEAIEEYKSNKSKDG